MQSLDDLFGMHLPPHLRNILKEKTEAKAKKRLGSNIKGFEKYEERIITSPTYSINLIRKGYNQHLTFGDTLHIRSAGSKPGQFRIILDDTGPTIVFSIDSQAYLNLLSNSKEVTK
jgi:hypothetical protein